MSDTPRHPDEQPDAKPADAPAPDARPARDEGYDLAPEESPRRKDERPLKSIGSLMQGIDEDAAADEKAAARTGDDARAASSPKFDPRTGRRRPRVLTDESGENGLKSDDGPLVAVGKLGWKGPAIVACTLFIVNVVLAVVGAPKGEVWREVGYELLHTPIDIALGFVALFVLSRLAERPLGFWKGAVARIAVAVVAFHAMMNLDLEFGGALIVQWVAGAALYFAALWTMTRAALRETFVMAVVHFGLWALVLFLFWLAPLVAPKAEPSQEVARPARQVDQVSPGKTR